MDRDDWYTLTVHYLLPLTAILGALMIFVGMPILWVLGNA